LEESAKEGTEQAVDRDADNSEIAARDSDAAEWRENWIEGIKEARKSRGRCIS